MAWSRTVSVLTTASAESVWKRWTTPEDWATDDPGTDEAQFATPARVGAHGTVRSGHGTQKFTFTDLRECDRMEFHISLPGGKISFPHAMAPVAGGLSVTHGVRVTGPLAFIYVLAAGKSIARGLPEVVDLVVTNALNESAGDSQK